MHRQSDVLSGTGRQSDAGGLVGQDVAVSSAQQRDDMISPAWLECKSMATPQPAGGMKRKGERRSPQGPRGE
ncbi:hypothetical protein AMELA_G00162100 [Ameiurus melas]|uniref:Uncharacterized protein n=1 Tax=Ameiurus melas TaxID=219545 RepID=A0A7J6AEZ7_AMEME|nr:hypothetical protein AMELA_G00162100 [Ameiurus melas]